MIFKSSRSSDIISTVDHKNLILYKNKIDEKYFNRIILI